MAFDFLKKLFTRGGKRTAQDSNATSTRILPTLIPVAHDKIDKKLIDRIKKLPKGAKVALEMGHQHPDIPYPPFIRECINTQRDFYHTDYFTELAKTCEKHGVNVIWLETPRVNQAILNREYEYWESNAKNEYDKLLPSAEADLKRMRTEYVSPEMDPRSRIKLAAISSFIKRAGELLPLTAEFRSRFMAHKVKRTTWGKQDLVIVGAAHAEHILERIPQMSIDYQHLQHFTPDEVRETANELTRAAEQFKKRLRPKKVSRHD